MYIVLLCHVIYFLSTASTLEETIPPSTTTPPQTVQTTYSPQNVGTTSLPQTVGTTSPPQTVGTTSPPQTVGTFTTTGTVQVSDIQPTNNPSSDGTTTTSVIIVVAVVIILVVTVVGVVILMVLFRAKKKKQKLVLSRLQNVTGEKEIELKQDKTNGKEVSSKPEQPLYAVVQKKVSSRSEDVDQTCALSEYKMAPAGCEYALTATFPRVVNLTNPMFEEMESNPIYQNMNECHDPPCTTNVTQGDDISNVPDITSSHTVETKSGTHETVYSEPIHGPAFTLHGRSWKSQ